MKERRVRTYGDPPYRVVVVHGGPGAAGEMAPVARVLARRRGVLEPMQTADSVDGQVQELREVLEREAARPAVLVGFSWGAWLSFVVTAYHPDLVSKLILVSSGPFEARYADGLETTRLARLTDDEREALETCLANLRCGTVEDRDGALAELGILARKTDAYDPIPEAANQAIVPDAHIFDRVWSEAAAMRRRGELLELGKTISCPVVAIHGAYDPHPVEGVLGPLAKVLKDFRFVLLKHCGHTPWIERQAREAFFRTLREAIPVKPT